MQCFPWAQTKPSALPVIDQIVAFVGKLEIDQVAPWSISSFPTNATIWSITGRADGFVCSDVKALFMEAQRADNGRMTQTEKRLDDFP